VRAFSDGVFDVIEQEPDRLREVTGIGPKRAERIAGGWAEQKVIREIMLFLHGNETDHPIGPRRVEPCSSPPPSLHCAVPRELGKNSRSPVPITRPSDLL
jgi:hypothetical protein